MSEQMTEETLFYTGFWECESRCRLRVFRSGERVIAIATQLLDDEDTSVTNMAERLASRVRWELKVPVDDFVWIEHYPAQPDPVFGVDPESFALVEFALDGRGDFHKPTWQHRSWEQVEALIGASLPVLE